VNETLVESAKLVVPVREECVNSMNLSAWVREVKSYLSVCAWVVWEVSLLMGLVCVVNVGV